MNSTPPPLTPETAAQLVNLLPTQWQSTANVVIQIVIAFILGAHFVATHGGLEGIKNSIRYGKKPE